DVEGNEEAVLEGAAATLARERPNLIIEVEERHNAGSVLRVARFLGNLSYDGFYLLDGELKPISSFDAAHDQDIHNVGLQGKVGRYINNFIYVPRERVGTLLSACHPGADLQ
ncbi:MAG: FkbM family methyltransferase, partial [Aquabacterium sp.]|nr:FkbM family methyltransferase [Aquabacterium sp.]